MMCRVMRLWMDRRAEPVNCNRSAMPTYFCLWYFLWLYYSNLALLNCSPHTPRPFLSLSLSRNRMCPKMFVVNLPNAKWNFYFCFGPYGRTKPSTISHSTKRRKWKSYEMIDYILDWRQSSIPTVCECASMCAITWCDDDTLICVVLHSGMLWSGTLLHSKLCRFGGIRH